MTHYDRPPSERVIVPFELYHDPMERLLIVDFGDDPDYEGLELLVFDDGAKGRAPPSSCTAVTASSTGT
jgi:hypothetical protein